ncbi:ABC transporter permease [Magnetovibrio sp. PR-2]|uniref:MlaE family ABC transporter permease n=1 Tax=Magnetovibrio sp. PR-2 TaxID=3120356 RepID=UPI002FCDEF09
MADEPNQNAMSRFFDRVGRATVSGMDEVGRNGFMLVEGIYWLIVGPRMGQPVRMSAVFAEMMEIGVRAIGIIGIMAAAIGAMLAIQGIYSLKIFGAEGHVVVGVAFSMVREFAPLITGILVAGRSGSALSARLGTMKINQELDALEVMGINPTRFLVVPSLISSLVMVPVLTFMSMALGLYAAALYVNAALGMSLAAFFDQTIDVLSLDDLLHGLGKAAIFGILIALIGVLNGFMVKGGAEGVGKATTRSVVQCISAIVVTDMLFALVATF